MAKFKKKPTIKEVSELLIQVNKKVDDLFHIVRDLDNLFGLYVRMNKDVDNFNKYVEAKVEEVRKKREKANDSKENGNPDTENIQADTVNEGSRAEGVREKAE
tara:strand:+ start:1782 stop:2090 length:309 start_codon:yes stop_codon:yes gene_type:complete